MSRKIKTLLVANRGEIACRVIRTAKAMGIRAVAVYSEADAGAPHVQQADDAVLIGSAPVSESYLNAERIIDAAGKAGADAVHPGYGFLSENAAFSEACEAGGLVFVGPPARAIEQMGNKAEAKRLMIAAGVPCVPGYEDRDQSDDAFIEAALQIGYPVMVKAAAGGGGRGMRLVGKAEELPGALKLARSEAENAFGSGELILEKAVLRPRHVEIQVFADGHGNIIHMGERDCSVQRRHQKVIEEAPSPAVDEELRVKMGAAAVEAARAVGYVGAGTVEFLLDGDGQFYFLEMNTRLQVEHPVTEMVTGLDLVELQLRVAEGEPLALTQDDIRLDGHAIEVRLYAEDPAQDFLPSTGTVALWKAPDGEGVRVDAGIVSGQMISPYYDPMLAKIIAFGPTRDIARQRLGAALGRTAIFGPATNRDFLIEALGKQAFSDGAATTAFIGEAFADRHDAGQPDFREAAVAAVFWFLRERDRAYSAAGWVSAGLLNWSSRAPVAAHVKLAIGADIFDVSVIATGDRYKVATGGENIEISGVSIDGNCARLCTDRRTLDVIFLVTEDAVFVADGANSRQWSILRAGQSAGDAGDGGGRVTAPMHGRIVDVLVEAGTTVRAGDRLAVLEAMKMQHQIAAQTAGRVAAVHVAAGDQVSADDLLMEIEPD